MEHKYFKYSSSYNFFRTIVTLSFILTLLLVLYGSANNLSIVFKEDMPVQFVTFQVVSLFCFATLVMLPIILSLVQMLTTFPALSIGPEGFKVHSPIHQSKWHSWQSITKIRTSFLPFRPFLMVEIRGISWLYRFNGLLFWMRHGGFLIGSNIENYHELLKILQAKRPDLFYE